jgi:hypothetical protein
MFGRKWERKIYISTPVFSSDFDSYHHHHHNLTIYQKVSGELGMYSCLLSQPWHDKGGKWSAVCAVHMLCMGKELPGPIAQGLGRSQSQPRTEDGYKILCWESNPGHPDHSLVPILTELPSPHFDSYTKEI